jgi:hypothetical protein
MGFKKSIIRYTKRTPGAEERCAGLEQEPPLGAHLATSRFGYTHHGIYVGRGNVVHYAGLCRSWHSGAVEEVTLAQFSSRHPVWIVDHPESVYSSDEIVRRARSRVGEHAYRLLTNNCEHFSHWCVSSRSRSLQIEHRWEIPAAAVALATRLISRLLLAREMR